VVHAAGPSIPHAIVVNRTFSFTRQANPGEDIGAVQPPGISEVVGAGSPEGVLHSIVSENVRPLPRAAMPSRPPLHQSVVMEGNLIHKVEPQYPIFAKQLHIQGTVIVKALISRDGVIMHAEAESGQPLLVKAALDAVRQWRYRPYYLNHEPIEVETEITVNFVLER
jgi:protein TonB